MDDQRLILAIYVCSFGLGSVLIASLTVRRPLSQIALTIVIALVGYGLFHADAATPDLLDTPGGDLLGFIVIALGTLAIGHFVFGAWLEGLRLQSRLQPRLWSLPETPSTSLEVAKRWFVTIAASTGSLVATLAADKDFGDLLSKALSPNRLVIALIITAVSVVLVGPVEQFVFGAGIRAGHNGRGGAETGPGHFEVLLQNVSWKAAGRIALVLLLVFLINVTHSCLEERLNGRDSQTSLVIILATVPAAVSTYFWCAALQRAEPKLVTKSTEGSAAASLLLFLPATVMFAVNMSIDPMGSTSSSTEAMQVVVMALLLALGLGMLTTGLPTLVGGLVLRGERSSRKASPLRAIFLMMVAVASLNCASFVALVAVMGAMGLFSGPIPIELLIPTVAASIGWGLGLLVSGFPDILKRAAPASELASV